MLSTCMAINAEGILVYIDNGKSFEIVGGAKGEINLRELPKNK